MLEHDRVGAGTSLTRNYCAPIEESQKQQRQGEKNRGGIKIGSQPTGALTYAAVPMHAHSDVLAELVMRSYYIPQRRAGACTDASQRRFISSSIIDTVTEQPAMSSEVT
jgi:hypothetical protein